MPGGKERKMHKSQQIVLFSLISYYDRMNRKFSEGHVAVYLSKAMFVAVFKQLNPISRETRTIYKILEFLEKKRYISYQGRRMKITPKARRFYDRKLKEMKPFMKLITTPDQVLFSTLKRAQTVLTEMV